jgi:hypothetical protein
MGFLAMGIFAACSQPVDAAALSSLFTNPNAITNLEDADYESVLAGGGDGTLDDGDLVGGVLKIQRAIYANDPVFPLDEVNLQSTPDTFTALFLIKVLDVNDDNDVITFGAATQGEWTAAFGGMTGLTGFTPTKGADGTMVFVFDGVAFSAATPGVMGGDYVDSADTFVTGGRLLWEFGFTADDGDAATGEFWRTTGDDANDIFGAVSNDLTNRFSLNVTKQHAGIDLILHNWLGDTGDDNFETAVALQGKGGFEGTNVGNWQLSTDSDIYVQAIPEPGSMTLVAFGAISCLGYGWRRRKQLAA